MRDLHTVLLEDLKTLGVELPYTQLVFKPYSKTLYACYRAKADKIYLYLYKDVNKTEIYSYQHYLSEVLHECCHVIQYYDPEWVRKKGVMHDPAFWEMLDSYLLYAEQFFYLFNKEVIVKDGKFFACKKSTR